MKSFDQKNLSDINFADLKLLSYHVKIIEDAQFKNSSEVKTILDKLFLKIDQIYERMPILKEELKDMITANKEELMKEHSSLKIKIAVLSTTFSSIGTVLVFLIKYILAFSK